MVGQSFDTRFGHKTILLDADAAPEFVAVEAGLDREHVADLRAENVRLVSELDARRREVATLHSILGQMMRGPWVYVDDDQSPRWA